MTGSLRVVCRPALCDGFALAGVRGIPATDAVEAAALLSKLREDPKIAVVFVEAKLFDALPEPLRESLEEGAIPVVVPFPSPRAAAPPSVETELVEVLHRAIGYRVRLR